MADDRAALIARRGIGALAYALPLAFVAIFFVYPVATIVARGLTEGGRLDLAPVGEVLTDARLREVLVFTFGQAALSTALTLAVGLPAAYVLSRFVFPGRSLARALVTVPFVLPTVVVGAAFLALGATPGLAAILAAHVFFNVAVVVRTVGSLWAHLDPRPEEAARTLGAGRLRALVTVTLPALRPAIGAAAAIVFLFCFTSFGVILLLGGPARSTLETEIYRQTAELLNLRRAAALSIVQLLAVLATVLVAGWLGHRRSAALALRPAAETARRPRGAEWLFVVGVLGGLAAFLGAPIAVLVRKAFEIGGGLGLGNFTALAERGRASPLPGPALDAVTTSLRVALLAMSLALAVGAPAAFAIARRRRSGAVLDVLLVLPLGVSAVTVGFGFLIALDEWPLDLRTSPWIVPLAHALVAVPFVVRAMVPVLRAIDPHVREAAAVLGAPPGRVWWTVDVPIVRRAMLLGAGFAAAISLGEFGATLFIARPETLTLPVAIYRLLGRPGATNYGQAMAASVVLMACTAAVVLLLERVRTDTESVF